MSESQPADRSVSGPRAAEAPNHIARSVASVLRSTQRALSPWVQRTLRREAGTPAPDPLAARPRPGPNFGAAARPAGLSVVGADRVLRRVQRAAEPIAGRLDIGERGPIRRE